MAEASTPRVTVIIPAFNMERHLSRTLDSLQAQTLTSFEVIVVDDCSTDDTSKIVRARLAADSRIRYIRLESNSNRPAVPRNRGLAEASGEYVAFLDHDDLWSRSKLERQVMILDARPDLALVHSYLWDFTEDSRLLGLLYLPNPYRRRATYETLRQRNVVQCSSVMARTSVLKELGGFDERPELRAVEDYHLWLRIAREHKIAYISEIHGFYRCSASGTSSQENMIARLRYLDEHEGTQLIANQTSFLRRVGRKLGGYPLALYVHLLEGKWRQGRKRMPRLFE